MVKSAVARTVDLDPIDRLEDKVKLLVGMVTQLRAERARVVAENARLTEELEGLRSQVADLDGEPLGKPGTHENARAQLRRMSGRTVIFQTALAVVCEESGFVQQDLAPVRVRFRTLDDDEIENYLRAEQPYDCAGSAKSEGLGIALLESIDNDDPTALVGLPLIRTCRMLRAAGGDETRLPSLHSPFWAPEADTVISTATEAMTVAALDILKKG